MIFSKKNKLAIGDINRLVSEKAKLDDALAKVQRERDLRIDTLNKKYESKLDKLMRRQTEVNILLKNTKEYVEKV